MPVASETRDPSGAERLPPERLYTPCNPDHLPFAGSEELAEIGAGFAHERAVEALRFGLGIGRPGFNLFVLGDPGSGRHALVHELIGSSRGAGEAPADWCYVNNFAQATRPRLLRLPAGRGRQLKETMQGFVAELATAISAAFESSDYRSKIEALEREYKKREEDALAALGEDARGRGIALLQADDGMGFAPLKDGDETLSEDEFGELPEARRAELANAMEGCEDRLASLLREFPLWRRAQAARIKELSRDALRLAVGHLIDEIKPAWADLPDVVAFLDACLEDVVGTGETLRETKKSEDEMETLLFSGSISVQRYLVNLFVDNAGTAGPPVVCEDHPTFQNLIGRVEHLAHLGVLVSNFTLIRAGALQRANGGTLILDAGKLLVQPYAWEGLKRALGSRQVRIESLGEIYGLASTVQLEPEPMPIDLKVVLVGERLVYYLLAELDPEFAQLFKVAADFESDVERSAENTLLYARLLATLARREGLLPLSRDALARAIEHAARLADDAARLSTQTRRLADLLREADHCAAKAGATRIERHHVEQALVAAERRADRLREQQHSAILRGLLLIASDGVAIGQVNGLAAALLGDFSFAQPVRVTAGVRLGEGEVVDIEREVELGGPVHSKGVLILAAFLATRFGRLTPLSLAATLAFEQSYGEIEGDSASLAELCALLSAIAMLPLAQSLAVTGSVNQHGAVQPIGAVNEKIEGFFDICKARGLTGRQGVIIPAANVQHLMLRHDVVETVAAGQFAVYAVDHVDQAIALLSGLPIGTPDAQGNVPEGTVNYRVAEQLHEMAAARQEFGGVERKHKKPAKARARPAKEAPPAPADGGGEPGEPPAGEGGG
ncbi:Lon protease family protein [Azospira restricta]|uniref:endopeptidase La n=1 Tax=Azospira restricta TaxID=404405 RepID=A0A974Y4H1_9RHOO|nr:ATP-binding protein [Azospira restricta]QRJ64534.1 AAA family ATPase [Azospira restricta]